MESRFNEVAGDQPNLFMKWRVCYIENFDMTNLRGNDQNVRYIEVIVALIVTQVTSVEILWCQCIWHVTSNFNMKVSAGEGVKSCGIHTSLWT